jgi:hypothetical protein
VPIVLTSGLLAWAYTSAGEFKRFLTQMAKLTLMELAHLSN